MPSPLRLTRDTTSQISFGVNITDETFDTTKATDEIVSVTIPTGSTFALFSPTNGASIIVSGSAITPPGPTFVQKRQFPTQSPLLLSLPESGFTTTVNVLFRNSGDLGITFYTNE